MPYLRTTETKTVAETMLSEIERNMQSGKNWEHMLNLECIKHINTEYQFKEGDVLVATFPKTGK